ncbi:MAG TPA: response regulator [Polyangiaceae bacterium]|nr:response regulator [Polyangiaceae bacterium]
MDDDEMLLTAIRRLFAGSEPEWDIRTASDGKEALQLVERHEMAVVITDLLMPRGDGYALLRHLAANHPSTVRIIHSSHPATQSELGGASAHRVVHKPASPAHLLAIARWAVRQAAVLARGSDKPDKP